MELTLNDVFADDTHAVSLVRLEAERPDRPGKHMDVKEANVFHLDAEGPRLRVLGRRGGPGGDQRVLDVRVMGGTHGSPHTPSFFAGEAEVGWASRAGKLPFGGEIAPLLDGRSRSRARR